MKQHFVALDGLRGVAAMGVMLFHYGVWTHRSTLMAHGYLAVDFFFALSGFVVMYAYSGRLLDGRMSFVDFVRVRIMRLWPLTILSIIAAWLVRSSFLFAGYPTGGDTPFSLSLDLIAGLFLIPIVWKHGLASPLAYPLNGAAWSIFFEFAVNFLWARFALRWSNRWIVAAIIAAFALVAAAASVKGEINFGAGKGLPFVLGLPRTILSFGLGILCYRFKIVNSSPRWTVSFTVAAALLVVILLAPITRLNVAFDLFAIVIAFPVIVVFGAAQIPGRNLTRVARALGDISFPIYAIHYLVYLFATLVAGVHGDQLSGTGLCAISGASVMLAWAVNRYVDAPLRNWRAGVERRLVGR